MPEIEPVVKTDLRSSLELTSSLIEQLGKAFVELDSHEDACSDNVQRNDVEGHFRHLESLVKKKLEEFEDKEKKFIEKESQLAGKEAAVIAKEQDLLDKVQELKDAAVSAIREARASYMVSSVNDENAPHRSGISAEVVAETRALLIQFCEQMDSKGLLQYVTENLDDLSSVCREQLSVVLGSATEPARLLLAALEGFFPPSEMTQHGDNGDSALHCMRQSCLLLMEALCAFLAKAESADNILNPENKQHAKAIAGEWKPKLALESSDAANGRSLEARAFLRLLVTFRIASEFDKEELCKYVLATAHHRQATELCRSLELTEKIPGLVETLIGKGRQIEAVNFALSFQLAEAFPPVPLLKAYLKDVRRNLQGNGDPDMQNNCNERELGAVKSVMRCIKEYKLDADFPLDPLRKRFVQLQRSVWDRKRKRERGRHQPQKEAKGPGGHGSQAHDAVAGRQGPPPFFSEKAAYNSGLAESYSPAVSSAYNYPSSSQVPYTAQANVQNAYSFPISSQPTYTAVVNDQRSHYYAPDNGASASYSVGVPTYDAYVQPSSQPYR